MNSSWNLSMDEWLILSRCNRFAQALFSRDRKAADEWGEYAYVTWQIEGVVPEDLAVMRAPGLAKRLGRAVNIHNRRSCKGQPK